MEIIKTIETENGKKIEIFASPDGSNPRQYDNLAKMVCFHERYILGDEHNYSSGDYSSFEEMKKDIIKRDGAVIVEPLYMYEHGGITISTTPFSCPWDSGQLGFVIVTKDGIKNNFGVKRVTKKLIEKSKEILQSEVEEYKMYLEGDVYGFRCYDKDGNITDSCTGFFGTDFEKNGMLCHISDEDIVATLKEEGSVF